MKGTFEIKNGVLVPIDQATTDLLAKQAEGSIYVLDIKPSRNPLFHSRAFALLKVLFDMVDSDIEFNPWRKLLTIKAGFYTSVGKVCVKGVTSVAVEADSLSFEKMDNEEFQECWQGLHRAFYQKYGERISFDELMEWSEM